MSPHVFLTKMTYSFLNYSTQLARIIALHVPRWLLFWRSQALASICFDIQVQRKGNLYEFWCWKSCGAKSFLNFFVHHNSSMEKRVKSYFEVFWTWKSSRANTTDERHLLRTSEMETVWRQISLQFFFANSKSLTSKINSMKNCFCVTQKLEKRKELSFGGEKQNRNCNFSLNSVSKVQKILRTVQKMKKGSCMITFLCNHATIFCFL